MPESLSSFLKKEFGSKKDSQAVADKALAVSIKHMTVGVRWIADDLLVNAKLSTSGVKSMHLGSSQSLSRHKLRFSVD